MSECEYTYIGATNEGVWRCTVHGGYAAMPDYDCIGGAAPEGGDDVGAALSAAEGYAEYTVQDEDEAVRIRRGVAVLRQMHGELDEARRAVRAWGDRYPALVSTGHRLEDENRRLREALEEAEAGLEFAVAHNPSSWKQSTDRQALRIVRCALSSTESEAANG